MGSRTANDPTGFECTVNKWHIDDLVPTSKTPTDELAALGWSFSRRLYEKILTAPVTGNLRLIMSVADYADTPSAHTCTVRVHKVRPAEPWLRDDLETYEQEALATVDWTQ